MSPAKKNTRSKSTPFSMAETVLPVRKGPTKDKTFETIVKKIAKISFLL
jgi:hypothetical protein